MDGKISLYSRLLREVEADIGTSETAQLVIDALGDSIRDLKIGDKAQFCAEFSKIVDIFSKTEPKFGILNYHLGNLKKIFDKMPDNGWREFAINACEDIRHLTSKHKHDLIRQSEKIELEGKTILIHDHSRTVQDVLTYLRRMGKHFRVIIAEQDFEKTRSNIEKMHASRIPFQVIPAYMLSHILNRIDMVFFGALTLKDTMHFVMDPGTHGIISELHVVHKPIYAFLDTAKFSLWKSKMRSEIFIHKDVRVAHTHPIEYERVKYSHDRVPADLFSYIVTEVGIFDPKGIGELFNQRMMEKEAREKENGGK